MIEYIISVVVILFGLVVISLRIKNKCERQFSGVVGDVYVKDGSVLHSMRSIFSDSIVVEQLSKIIDKSDPRDIDSAMVDMFYKKIVNKAADEMMHTPDKYDDISTDIEELILGGDEISYIEYLFILASVINHKHKGKVGIAIGKYEQNVIFRKGLYWYVVKPYELTRFNRKGETLVFSHISIRGEDELPFPGVFLTKDEIWRLVDNVRKENSIS